MRRILQRSSCLSLEIRGRQRTATFTGSLPAMAEEPSVRTPKMQLHEAAQKARLSIDFTLDETSSGFAASVAVASRDDELPDAINATSDPMPTRREAEQAAASLVLPSLRDAMPHAFPSKPGPLEASLALSVSLLFPSLSLSQPQRRFAPCFARAHHPPSISLADT